LILIKSGLFRQLADKGTDPLSVFPYVLSLIAVRSPFIRAFVSTARQTTESARQMPVKKNQPDHRPVEDPPEITC